MNLQWLPRRAEYYFRRLSVFYQQKGILFALREAAGFLWRRKFFASFLAESIEYHCIAPWRSIPRTVRKVLQQSKLHSDRVAIYVGFDRDSKILTHVEGQVRALKNAGYEIIFVSTSPEMPDSEFSKIKDQVAVGLHRENQGYDFVSWKVGYSFLEPHLSNCSSVVLMNDSCLGPYFDLAPVLEQMRSASDSIYGITLSTEMGPFIQSYFFHFSEMPLKTGAIGGFMDRIRILNSKWGIVRYFEIGGSRYLMDRGYQLKALIDAREARIQARLAKAGAPEPTRDPLGSAWVEEKLNPFYKRSNVKSNINGSA